MANRQQLQLGHAQSQAELSFLQTRDDRIGCRGDEGALQFILAQCPHD